MILLANYLSVQEQESVSFRDNGDLRIWYITLYSSDICFHTLALLPKSHLFIPALHPSVYTTVYEEYH